MLASHGMRTFVLLAAVALSACGSDNNSGYEPPNDSLPAYTAGDAQASPAVRTAIADLIAVAVVGEGRITGVTAGSALRTRQLRSLLRQVLESSPARSAPRRLVRRQGAG